MEKAIKIGLMIGIALFLRCCITHHPYSGENIPPMYGDYEAQRHWQEITFNLPMEVWYKNTSDNNLEYWGLDYPPLTAYHSFIIGKIANKINPKFIELYKSRGYESNEHKFFMRMSVMISDLFLYIIPMILFYLIIANSFPKNNERIFIFCIGNFEKFCITALIYPGIILIDHGHFQYNCVSLGLFLIACVAIDRGNFSIASFFFVLALNYKQMELYHASSFFAYILGKCLFDNREKKSFLLNLKLFLSVSFTVLLTFIVIWAPFWIKDSTAIFDIAGRLFPITRGIFEDKVSNVWCLINIFIKLRYYYSNIELAEICLFTTTISILPSSIDLFLNPTKDKFFISLINNSMIFYLFSFQVHEKSILLVAIPVVLYFHRDPFICFWFLIISTFSMVPLLIKDGLFIAYCGLMIIYFFTVRLMWRNYFFSLSMFEKYDKHINNKLRFITAFCFYVSIGGILLLSLASICLKPPEIYPDLFSLLISVYSCIHFILFSFYFQAFQIFFTINPTMKKSKLH